MNRLLDPTGLRQAKILVRVPNWVGDAVMCLPALRTLRAALPDAEITLLARPWVRDVFPVDELRARVIPYDTSAEHAGWSGRRRIAAALRNEKFDAAILFQNAFDAALITWLAGIPLRAGYSRQGRRLLLTHRVAPPKGRSLGHESHYYLEMLHGLGLIESYPPVERISLPSSAASRTSARARLNELIANEAASHNAQYLVGISPGATFGTAKRWPAPRYAELATRLRRETGAVAVYFGSPQERELAEEVRALAGVPAVMLAGKTSLAEFIALIQGCDLFLTNDTGTMHVAAALGVPTLAIFGPTNDRETQPLGAHVEIITGEAFCRPCKLRHCPIDHRCMTSVGVERVFQAALRLLAGEPLGQPAAIAAEERRAILGVDRAQ
jgi:lipopolysaccharide heptosyltransferase II